jgi:hypothetical protein
MAYYVKANRKVYERFNFSVGERFQLKDTNYLLWQADLLKLGNELNIPIGTDFEGYLREVAAQIGALVLTAAEAKSEQDGTSCRELPEAKDARFLIEAEKTEDAAEPETTGEAKSEDEGEEGDITGEGKEAEDEHVID